MVDSRRVRLSSLPPSSTDGLRRARSVRPQSWAPEAIRSAHPAASGSSVRTVADGRAGAWTEGTRSRAGARWPSRQRHVARQPACAGSVRRVTGLPPAVDAAPGHAGHAVSDTGVMTSTAAAERAALPDDTAVDASGGRGRLARIALAVVAGLLLDLVFPPHDLWLLAPVPVAVLTLA